MKASCNIRVGTQQDLQAAARLWSLLDHYHHSIGMEFPVPIDAEREWIQSFERTLGRFSFLWVAEQNGKVEGFLLARLKRTPGFLGGVMVGEISDLYVGDSLRGMGVGKRLVENAMELFSAQGVHSVEVQVMVHNEGGLAFWKSVGFQEDVILVRQLKR